MPYSVPRRSTRLSSVEIHGEGILSRPSSSTSEAAPTLPSSSRHLNSLPVNVIVQRASTSSIKGKGGDKFAEMTPRRQRRMTKPKSSVASGIPTPPTSYNEEETNKRVQSATSKNERIRDHLPGQTETSPTTTTPKSSTGKRRRESNSAQSEAPSSSSKRRAVQERKMDRSIHMRSNGLNLNLWTRKMSPLTELSLLQDQSAPTGFYDNFSDDDEDEEYTRDRCKLLPTKRTRDMSRSKIYSDTTTSPHRHRRDLASSSQGTTNLPKEPQSTVFNMIETEAEPEAKEPEIGIQSEPVFDQDDPFSFIEQDLPKDSIIVEDINTSLVDGNSAFVDRVTDHLKGLQETKEYHRPSTPHSFAFDFGTRTPQRSPFMPGREFENIPMQSTPFGLMKRPASGRKSFGNPDQERRVRASLAAVRSPHKARRIRIDLEEERRQSRQGSMASRSSPLAVSDARSNCSSPMLPSSGSRQERDFSAILAQEDIGNDDSDNDDERKDLSHFTIERSFTKSVTRSPVAHWNKEHSAKRLTEESEEILADDFILETVLVSPPTTSQVHRYCKEPGFQDDAEIDEETVIAANVSKDEDDGIDGVAEEEDDFSEDEAIDDLNIGRIGQDRSSCQSRMRAISSSYLNAASRQHLSNGGHDEDLDMKSEEDAMSEDDQRSEDSGDNQENLGDQSDSDLHETYQRVGGNIKFDRNISDSNALLDTDANETVSTGSNADIKEAREAASSLQENADDDDNESIDSDEEDEVRDGDTEHAKGETYALQYHEQGSDSSDEQDDDADQIGQGHHDADLEGRLLSEGGSKSESRSNSIRVESDSEAGKDTQMMTEEDESDAEEESEQEHNDEDNLANSGMEQDNLANSGMEQDNHAYNDEEAASDHLYVAKYSAKACQASLDEDEGQDDDDDNDNDEEGAKGNRIDSPPLVASNIRASLLDGHQNATSSRSYSSRSSSVSIAEMNYNPQMDMRIDQSEAHRLQLLQQQSKMTISPGRSAVLKLDRTSSVNKDRQGDESPHKDSSAVPARSSKDVDIPQRESQSRAEIASVTRMVEEGNTTVADYLRDRVDRLAATSTIVEITSLNPEVAARCVAILKQHHQFLDRGLVETAVEEDHTGLGINQAPDQTLLFGNWKKKLDDSIQSWQSKTIETVDDHLKQKQEMSRRQTSERIETRLMNATRSAIEVTPKSLTEFIPGQFPDTVKSNESAITPTLEKMDLRGRQAYPLHDQSITESSQGPFTKRDWNILEKLVKRDVLDLANNLANSEGMKKGVALWQSTLQLDIESLERAFIAASMRNSFDDDLHSDWSRQKIHNKICSLIFTMQKHLQEKYPERNYTTNIKSTAPPISNIFNESTLAETTSHVPYQLVLESTPAHMSKSQSKAAGRIIDEKSQDEESTLPHSNLYPAVPSLLPRVYQDAKLSQNSNAPHQTIFTKVTESSKSLLDLTSKSLELIRLGLGSKKTGIEKDSVKIKSIDDPSKIAQFVITNTKAKAHDASHAAPRASHASSSSILHSNASISQPSQCRSQMKYGNGSSLLVRTGTQSAVDPTAIAFLSPNTNKEAKAMAEQMSKSRNGRNWKSPRHTNRSRDLDRSSISQSRLR